MKNKFSNKKYSSRCESLMCNVGFSLRDGGEILNGNKTEEEVRDSDPYISKYLAQVGLQISMLEYLLRLTDTDTFSKYMRSKFRINAPYLPLKTDNNYYSALASVKESLAREIIQLYTCEYNLKQDSQKLQFSYTTDKTINISDALVEFLDELGFNIKGTVLRVELARNIMPYLEDINKHSDKIQEWVLTVRDLENVKSSEFYKYIGNEENLMYIDTVVDVYIQELKYKILEFEEKVKRKYGLKRKERSNHKVVKRDTETISSLYKLEAALAGDDISTKFNISSQLRDFLVSLGIELPSTTITKELGYNIKSFLEEKERSLIDLYGRLWELNHPEGVKPDAAHVESIDRKKLLDKIDQLNSFIEELNESVEISIK